MGIDYRAACGWTVPFELENLELHSKLKGYDDVYDMLEDLPYPLQYIETGCSYSGNIEYHIVFKPHSTEYIEANRDVWLIKVNQYFDTQFSIHDIKWIEDVYVF